MADQLTVHGAREWVRGFAALVALHADELTALDAEIGDGDHGANMTRGTAATLEGLDAPVDDVGSLLKKVGLTIVSTVGGASGPLYGTFFLRVGAACGDAVALDTSAVAAALRAGLDGVAGRGKSAVGEKTMLDALAPAVQAMDAAVGEGRSLPEALTAAARAAATGRDATADLLATKGRASYLGERSVGHVDPGAASATLLLESAAAAVQG